MNSVYLTGRVVKEHELKVTGNGNQVLGFTLAVQKDKDNAYFLNCVAFNKTAELLNAYTGKGSKVLVEGSLSSRSYDNQEGKKVYVTEVLVNRVEFLDSKKETETKDDLPF
jgi:single-strand DNA-binding protein